MTNQSIKRLVVAALLAAMTCIATMIIKIPTPTFGYIHLGDGFVLLCGIILGPLPGALAAGVGSMFSDIFSGYASFAPATLIIKALTAGIAGLLFRFVNHRKSTATGRMGAVIAGGLIGEAVMVTGYFAYEAGLAAITSGAFNHAALASGLAASAAGIPFNIVQGVVGIVLSTLLLPVLLKVPDVRECVNVNLVHSCKRDGKNKPSTASG